MDIIKYCEVNGLTFTLLSEIYSQNLLTELKDKFDFSYDKKFIWEGLKSSPFKIIEYGDKWEYFLSIFLQEFCDKIFLVITNEEFYPWMILEGNSNELIQLLKEHPFFEYFIFDRSKDYVLFDTHHNEFIFLKKNKQLFIYNQDN